MYKKKVYTIPMTAALVVAVLFALMSTAVAQTGAPSAKDSPVVQSPDQDLKAFIKDLAENQGPRAVQEFFVNSGNSFRNASPALPGSGASGKGSGRAYAWEKMGPSGGDFFAVASNPSNADEALVYGGRAGGLYRTYDGGQNWIEGPGAPNEDINAIYGGAVFDAFGPDERLYLTDIWSPLSPSGHGVIWHSADGGSTWTPFVLPPNYMAYTVRPHPTDPNIVFASGENLTLGFAVFYKSTDGGQTWTHTDLTTHPTSFFGGIGLDVCKANPDVLCMTIGWDTGYFPNVLKSIDGGTNWSNITPPGVGFFELLWPVTIDPTDENRIYAAGQSLYCSADGGATWTPVTVPSGVDGRACLGVDPNNPAKVYYGYDNGIYVSSDYGLTGTFHDIPEAGKWNIDVNPSSATVYCLAWDIAVTKTDDGGQTWNTCHNGILSTIISSGILGASPSVPETIYAGSGSLNFNLNVSHNSGNSWQVIPNLPFDYSGELIVNSNNPDFILAAGGDYGAHQIFMSIDAGSSWFSVLQSGYLTELVEHPHNSNTVYAVGYTDASSEYTVLFYESVDAGFTWTETVISGPSADRATGFDLDVSQTDPSILYLCGCEGAVGKIWASLDSGQNWIDATGDLGTYLDPTASYSDCRQIWMSPADPTRLVVGCYNAFGPEVNFVSTNAGTTWTPIPAMSESIYDYAVDFEYHPGLNRVYMAAQGAGVWKSDDQGLTWDSMNDGYPGADACHCLGLDLKNGYLFAGTTGNGVCRLAEPAAPLWVGLNEISAATGGSVDLLLNAPERVGHWYVLAGTLSGTQPGFDIGYTHVPLNYDWFTQFNLKYLNAPWFDGFFDQLDGEGKAQATLTLPWLPGWAGTVMNFAFVTIYPEDYASNPVDVIITQ